MDHAERDRHDAVTREAVRELFASGRADEHGRIDNMTEEQYYHALREWRRHPDGWQYPAHGSHHLPHDGASALRVNREYVENELQDAHYARRHESMDHLGKAVYALEDSYSEPYARRGPAAEHGDPTAPLESFDGGGYAPGAPHSYEHVSVDADGHLVRGLDQAAAHAAAHVLEEYTDHHNHFVDPEDTAMHVRRAVDPYYQGYCLLPCPHCQPGYEYMLCVHPSDHLEAHTCGHEHTWQ